MAMQNMLDSANKSLALSKNECLIKAWVTWFG